PARKLEHLEQLGDAPLHRVSFLPVQACHETEKLRTGELVVDERPVGDEAQAHLRGRRVVVDVVPTEQHPAVGGAEDPGDHPQRRGPAAPPPAPAPRTAPCARYSRRAAARAPPPRWADAWRPSVPRDPRPSAAAAPPRARALARGR